MDLPLVQFTIRDVEAAIDAYIHHREHQGDQRDDAKAAAIRQMMDSNQEAAALIDEGIATPDAKWHQIFAILQRV